MTDQKLICALNKINKRLTALEGDSNPGQPSASIQSADYIIERISNVTYARPRAGSGLQPLSNANSHTVLQGAVNALTPLGGHGSGGGHIHISKGYYALSDELTIRGWEQETNPLSQLIITGEGFSSFIVQLTANKNAIVLRDCVSFVFRDFRCYSGPNSLSALLGDDNGTYSEISAWKGTIDNCSFESNSATRPAVYLKNFFDISAPNMHCYNTNNHGLVLENTSESTNYGNSNFGFLRCISKPTDNFYGLVLRTTKPFKFPNLVTFDNYQCVNGYGGIYAKGAKFCSWNFVDLESNIKPIFFDGSVDGDETRHCTIKAGYLLVNNADTAITNTLFTGGNEFKVFIQSGNNGIPVLDQSQYRPANIYDLDLSSVAAAALINITSPATTPLKLKLVDTTVINRMTGVNTVPTPALSDNSQQIANTAFVKSVTSAASSYPAKRIGFWDAIPNTNTISVLGLGMNNQGTPTARTTVLTNYFTRQKRVGFLSATTANARAGVIGNFVYNTADGFIMKIVFGINTYNAGHYYDIGMGNFNGAGNNPSGNTQVLHMYADPGDTTFKIRGAGGSLGPVIELGANFPVNTSGVDVYEVTFVVEPNATTATYTVKRLNTAFVATGTVTVIPLSNTLESPQCIAGVLATGVAADIDILRINMITDN